MVGLPPQVNEEEQPFGRRVAADGGEEDVANAAVLVITRSTLAVPWRALSSLRMATDSAGLDGDDQPDGDDEPDSGPGMTVCLFIMINFTYRYACMCPLLRSTALTLSLELKPLDLESNAIKATGNTKNNNFRREHVQQSKPLP